MTTWKTWMGEDVVIPANIVAFMDEYEALCRKHNLMVASDGEPVDIGEADEELWHIRTNTADRIHKLNKRT